MSFFIAMLRFHEDATTHEHPGETDTIVICIDGSGFTSVGAEAAPITAGQEVRWPEGVAAPAVDRGLDDDDAHGGGRGPQPELRGRI